MRILCHFLANYKFLIKKSSSHFYKYEEPLFFSFFSKKNSIEKIYATLFILFIFKLLQS